MSWIFTEFCGRKKYTSARPLIDVISNIHVVTQYNMIMSSAGLGTNNKNNCAGEAQQQFTRPDQMIHFELLTHVPILLSQERDEIFHLGIFWSKLGFSIYTSILQAPVKPSSFLAIFKIKLRSENSPLIETSSDRCQ
jgi:hypothetical protein